MGKGGDRSKRPVADHQGRAVETQVGCLTQLSDLLSLPLPMSMCVHVSHTHTQCSHRQSDAPLLLALCHSVLALGTLLAPPSGSTVKVSQRCSLTPFRGVELTLSFPLWFVLTALLT